MGKRLTRDEEEWWEYLASGGGGDFTEEHCDLAVQALAEVRALRAERDKLRAYIEAVQDAEFASGGDYTEVSRLLAESP